MRKISSIFLATAVLLLSAGSCKKKDTTTPTQPSNTAPSVSTPATADGAFAAVKVISTQTVAGITIPIDIGTAAAWFGSASSPVDGGAVTCNTNALSKQGNNYIFTPTTSAPSGIDFSSSSVNWTIAGNSANSIPAFNHTDSGSFPSVDDISNTGDVDTHTAFTLTAASSVYGDSVIFNIAGPNGNVLKVMPPNTSSCTFTAAEMGTLGTGNNVGLLQIAPYRVALQVVSGKNYYFVRETCANKFVTLK